MKIDFKKEIVLDGGVKAQLEGKVLRLKGPKGEISTKIHPLVLVKADGGLITVKAKDDSKQARALWGTFRSLINNMVKGASEGFEKVLVYEGIGYKSEVKADSSVESGKVLELNVGFTHPIRVPAPKGIDFKAEKNQITISGADKELVGQIAADIRKIRPPEPYKGKGIRYKDEIIIRKAGKKAVTAA